MSSSCFHLLPFGFQFLQFLLLWLPSSSALNTDGVNLLSFKYSILSDPLGVLSNWNYNDQTPCSWTGVTCAGAPAGSSGEYSPVTGLSLPNSQLLGSLSGDLGLIQRLRIIDLSNNSINGSIPLLFFNASELRLVDFSNNLISGELPDLVGELYGLESLNLSDNAFAGDIPEKLTSLRHLTIVDLKRNYFSGDLPGGFDSVQVLDLSSNLITGSLPENFRGSNLRYFNASYNRLSGEILPEFATQIPATAVLDFSGNNLTGPIPETDLFMNQKTNSFSANPGLCGKPMKILCPNPIPSAPTTSPPAIAAIPKSIGSNSSTPSSESGRPTRPGLKPTSIIAIVVGDVAGISILALIILYIYRATKNRRAAHVSKSKDFDWGSADSSEESRWIGGAWACLRKRGNEGGDGISDTTSSGGSAGDVEEGQNGNKVNPAPAPEKAGSLVTVDGEKEMEIESLLKASAYILGATGSSIMYKAVLEDGTTMAVRRIGENGVDRFRDFENQVRVIAKLVHPNLVRIRGFYWGTDEKLVIYDFVPNGSLANARYRKVGSSPCHLPWEMRLKIAKGIARGLTYIHDKKHVHGNLKPSNILLGLDMEPKIGDFGLERLVAAGDNSYKATGSARNFGSKRSTASRESFQDVASGGAGAGAATPSPSPSSIGCMSPYYAPESLRSLKPNQKWDVYSFGVVLLELMTGKVIVTDELGPWPTTIGPEEGTRVLRMADVAIRADVEGREDAMLALFKLGFNCISPVPQKRPPMKEVLQALERFPTMCSSSSYYYGHS